ncbi:camp-dependent protein kinase catalytic subunit, partial [Rhizoclosmatium hyalinum]
TLANATSALTAARKVRSEHNLAEEQNTSGENSGESKADEPKPGFLKKASLHRSNTAGKMTHVFNSLEAKDVPVPVKPKTLSVTKDALAFTGRTSVTTLNKNNPSNISINQTGNGSVFALNNEDAPPMPLPFLNTPTSHPTIEPTLPKIGTLKAPRSATEQPMSLAKSTNQLFAGTGPSSQLGGSSIDIKYKNALQQGSPSQNQLLMAGNTGGHRDTSGNGFLSTTAAAAVARQEKRNAGLSAYEISTPSSAPSLKRYCLDDFHIVRRVGRGGFAIVFLVRMKQSTGRYFALKAIRKAEVVKLKQEKQIVNEKEILKSVKHNFIVELFHTFQDTHYLYMVMEYIDGGDLFSYLRKVQKFGDEDSKFYAAEVLMSLQYLHGENVIFRDLKPE